MFPGSSSSQADTRRVLRGLAAAVLVALTCLAPPGVLQLQGEMLCTVPGPGSRMQPGMEGRGQGQGQARVAPRHPAALGTEGSGASVVPLLLQLRSPCPPGPSAAGLG